jgi:hypothetical protein
MAVSSACRADVAHPLPRLPVQGRNPGENRMTFDVPYKGYDIKFSESDERWSCSPLNIWSESTLGAVKKKIDVLLHKDQQLNLPALHVGRGGFLHDGGVTEVTIKALYVPERDYHSGMDIIKSCWIIDEKGERKKASMQDLFPLDARPEINAWKALDEAAEKAMEIAKIARNALVSFNVDTLSLAAKEAKQGAKDGAATETAPASSS